MKNKNWYDSVGFNLQDPVAGLWFMPAPSHSSKNITKGLPAPAPTATPPSNFIIHSNPDYIPKEGEITGTENILNLSIFQRKGAKIMIESFSGKSVLTTLLEMETQDIIYLISRLDDIFARVYLFLPSENLYQSFSYIEKLDGPGLVLIEIRRILKRYDHLIPFLLPEPQEWEFVKPIVN